MLEVLVKFVAYSFLLYNFYFPSHLILFFYLLFLLCYIAFFFISKFFQARLFFLSPPYLHYFNRLSLLSILNYTHYLLPILSSFYSLSIPFITKPFLLPFPLHTRSHTHIFPSLIPSFPRRQEQDPDCCCKETLVALLSLAVLMLKYLKTLGSMEKVRWS